jgi:exodeoxyribonuclease VIII
MNPEFVPGHFPVMPAAEYHDIEALSSSGAKRIRKSPAHFRLMRTTANAPSPAMQFGTAVHSGVLEPATFADCVVCAPDVNKRTNLGKDVHAQFIAEHGHKVILSPSDFDRARRCIDAVLAHPAARHLLEGAEVEHSLFWNDRLFNVPCKARLDARKHGGITDLKSCQDASPEGFAQAIGAFDYHAQAWTYMSGAEHVLDATPEFFAFVAVETEPPHCVAVYHLGRDSLMHGARLWDEALARYKKAIDAGEWAGYSPQIETIDAPRWKLKF